MWLNNGNGHVFHLQDLVAHVGAVNVARRSRQVLQQCLGERCDGVPRRLGILRTQSARTCIKAPSPACTRNAHRAALHPAAAVAVATSGSRTREEAAAAARSLLSYAQRQQLTSGVICFSFHRKATFRTSLNNDLLKSSASSSPATASTAWRACGTFETPREAPSQARQRTLFRGRHDSIHHDLSIVTQSLLNFCSSHLGVPAHSSCSVQGRSSLSRPGAGAGVAVACLRRAGTATPAPAVGSTHPIRDTIIFLNDSMADIDPAVLHFTGAVSRVGS